MKYARCNASDFGKTDNIIFSEREKSLHFSAADKVRKVNSSATHPEKSSGHFSRAFHPAAFPRGKKLADSNKLSRPCVCSPFGTQIESKLTRLKFEVLPPRRGKLCFNSRMFQRVFQSTR